MKLDLTDITSHVGKHAKYDINEPCFDSEDSGITCKEPIVGRAEFRNTGRHLVVRGEVNTRVALDCSRCTGIFEIPVKLTLDDEFEIAGLQAILAGHEEEVEEEELEEETLLQDGIFDLSEFLRQSILVSLPIKPLCDDACLGLCPTCGTNLNEGPCDCPVNAEASPFAALKELLDTSEESGG